MSEALFTPFPATSGTIETSLHDLREALQQLQGIGKKLVISSTGCSDPFGHSLAQISGVTQGSSLTLEIRIPDCDYWTLATAPGLTALDIWTTPQKSKRLRLPSNIQFLSGDAKLFDSDLPDGLRTLLLSTVAWTDLAHVPNTVRHLRLSPARSLSSLRGIDSLSLQGLMLQGARSVVNWDSLASQTRLSALDLDGIGGILDMSVLQTTSVRDLWIANGTISKAELLVDLGLRTLTLGPRVQSDVSPGRLYEIARYINLGG